MEAKFPAIWRSSPTPSGKLRVKFHKVGKYDKSRTIFQSCKHLKSISSYVRGEFKLTLGTEIC